MIPSNLKRTGLTNDDRSKVSKENVVNEQVLSQELGQMSPFKQTNQNEKQQSSTDIIQRQSMTGMDFDIVPDYLSKTNKFFEQKILCILPPTIHLEELRDIAILLHKTMSIEIVHSLWMVYQKSGMGNLPLSTALLSTNPIDKRIWPKEVQSLTKRHSQILSRINEDNDACLTFVSHCLHDLNNKRQQYRHEFNVKTGRLLGYTRSMECTMEKFIRQNLECFRIGIDEQIALVQYYFTDQIFKRSYLSQNPQENQIKIMQRLCKLKYDQEMTKYEVNLLKEKISTHIPSHPFERESIIAQSTIIDGIRNPRIRQQIHKQYKNVAEQARNNMMTVYIKCAEGQEQQCQVKYDMALKEIYDVEKTLASNQRLTKTMWDLIQQLLANINTQIECVYQFKRRLFHLKSNIQ